MRIFTFIATLLMTLSPITFAAELRVVSLGGPLTEIVYALKAGQHLVAVDQSSTYPAAATKLPQVGYYRQFSLEGVLAAKPDLILASDQAGPPEAIAQLRSMGRRVVVLPSGADMASLEKRIEGVAEALNLANDGQNMLTQLRQQVQTLSQKPGNTKALMLMSRTGQPEGAGKNTSADAMMSMVGMKNVLANQQGYKPLSQESIAALRPEVIITTHRSIQSLGGMDKLLAWPGLAQSPAVREKRVLVMDDLLLLGFGPRLPEALRELNKFGAQMNANTLTWAGGVVVLLLMLLVAASHGTVAIPLSAMHTLFFADTLNAEQQFWRDVLVDIRLPRVLFSALAGGVLALAGATMQALFRNPLAEPGLIGISSGASLGAVCAIVLGGGSFAVLAPSAFLGSVIATALAYHLGRRVDGMAGLLLAGIAINAICGSLIGLFTYLADDNELRSLTFWNMGSLAGASWERLAFLAPFLLMISLCLLPYWRAMNALLLGEREALHLGFAMKGLRRKLIVLVALLIGPLVAATGGIGFVGLVIPHCVRMLWGADHRRLLPASFLLGAIALVLADWLARIAVQPAELPIGIVTSLIGGPFFLWLLLRRQH